MTNDIVGWLVRTESDGRHRYWKIGVAEPSQAAAIGREMACADTAKAVTRIRSYAAYALRPGDAIEVVWESRPVAQAPEASEIKARIEAGAKAYGEMTFDIVVPQEGVTHVEGCYRQTGGNWHVYYLTNRSHGGSPINAPAMTSDAVFSSGIVGVSGVVPSNWVLNKRRRQASPSQ